MYMRSNGTSASLRHIVSELRRTCREDSQRVRPHPPPLQSALHAADCIVEVAHHRAEHLAVVIVDDAVVALQHACRHLQRHVYTIECDVSKERAVVGLRVNVGEQLVCDQISRVRPVEAEARGLQASEGAVVGQINQGSAAVFGVEWVGFVGLGRPPVRSSGSITDSMNPLVGGAVVVAKERIEPPAGWRELLSVETLCASSGESETAGIPERRDPLRRTMPLPVRMTDERCVRPQHRWQVVVLRAHSARHAVGAEVILCLLPQVKSVAARQELRA